MYLTQLKGSILPETFSSKMLSWHSDHSGLLADRKIDVEIVLEETPQD